LRGADQAGLDVGGRIALRVPVIVLPGNEPVEGVQEVVHHVGVGVLIDEDAGGGVGDVDMAEAPFRTTL
jgi:hypothetical protein